MEKVKNVKLISNGDKDYRINNRGFKNKKRNLFKFKKVDSFASEHTKALEKWEKVVQQLLSKISNEYPERILKYSTATSFVNYKEIDFIAQPHVGQFIFCELKLKENFKRSMNQKTSGWKQLNKTLNIVSNSSYKNASALAICVDMSYVYGLESDAMSNDFVKYSDLHLSFTKAPEKKTIWLSSEDITSNAIKYGLLTERDIETMKELHQAMKDPLSILPPTEKIFTNNPFSALQSMSLRFS